jgi:glucose/arabinose dehydrogenase/mono/diheme cytochrome c family protein
VQRLKLFSSVNAVLILLLVGFTQCKSGLPAGDTDNGGLLLPNGFEAVVVVDSLRGQARHLAVNTNGDVYVKLMHPNADGGNAALRDDDNDGKADVIKFFGKYDDWGYGTAMRIHNGYLYFSSELVVYRYRLTPGKMVPDGTMEVVVTDDHSHGRHEHIAKPLAFDEKGNMYVAFGAPSDACQEMNRIPGSSGQMPCPLLADHGGIWRFDANKTGQLQKDGKRFATGLRSVVAMEWNKEDKNLYVVAHGRDDLFRTWPRIYSSWQSAVLPAEEFLRLKEGANVGWPYYYYDEMQHKKLLNAEYGGDGKKDGEGKKYEQPLIGFPGHWAPNDLVFYTGSQFPDHYKNGAFIAFHGSTNRAPYPQSGFFVCFVPFNKGVPSGPWEVFADGFAKVDPIVSVSDAVYRPMGIAIGPDGSMYVSDSEKGKIWRIMFKGDKEKFGEMELASMEKRKLSSSIRMPDQITDNLDRNKPTSAAKLYDSYCRPCHQPNGKGDGARFPPLDSSEWVIGDKHRLINTVLNGVIGSIDVNGRAYSGTMPPHNFLSDDDLAVILTYIRRNFHNIADSVSPQEVNMVRKK